ncbi:MAG: hypothetical protein VW171_04600 [Alphaproteobacteria bacterium]
MAQANIKDRIKEMRLRVLAEPLGDAAAQGDGSKSPKEDIPVVNIPEDNSKAPIDNPLIDDPKTDTPVIEKTTQIKTVKKTKSGKKKTSKKSIKQAREEAAEIQAGLPQQELKAQEDRQEREIQNQPGQSDEKRDKEIREADINREAETNEPLEIIEPIAKDNTSHEHKSSSDQIIDLTDKWVELEMRSRLSGLEQQEKQTRAMLKEIVEILDRIETPKHSNKDLPAVSATKRAPTSSPGQTPETKKQHWVDVIKRICVVIGTFVIFASIIWGIMLYLFFDI